MKRRHKQPETIENTSILVILLDAAIAFASLVLTFVIRFTLFKDVGSLEPGLTIGRYMICFVLGTIGLLIIFGHLRLYENQFLLSARRSFPRISRACLLWLVCYLAALKLLEPELPLLAAPLMSGEVPLLSNRIDVSRLFILGAPLVLLITMTFWRYILSITLRRMAKALHLIEHVVFVGWNRDAAEARKIMTRETGSPMQILGAIRPPSGEFSVPLPEGFNDYGDYERLQALLAEGNVDMLIATDTALNHEHLPEIITRCEKEMVGFRLVPTYFRVLLTGLHLDRVFGMPLLGISKLPLNSGVNVFLKRVIDTLGGLIGLVLSAPLIAICGALIYLESPGPIFYRQRRVGQGGREFDIIKLRSMRTDSEVASGPVWTVENDTRRLRIGSFLRAWNIDEVPQFWNVLKGEMSLVGPRPERPEFIEKFRDEIPHYNARHSIKPGITGWAQVNGLRGNTDLSERIKYDLHYIERWNLLLDFQIMLLTFFKKENAY